MRRSHRLVLLAGLALAMGLIGADLARRFQTPAYRDAAIIAAGYQRAGATTQDAAGDADLTGTDDEAGYRWAERHGVDRTEACPAPTSEFRKGCDAWVREQIGSAATTNKTNETRSR